MCMNPIMNQRIAECYEAPLVEVIEVVVEQGFSTSISGDAFSGDAFGDEGVVITPPIS